MTATYVPDPQEVADFMRSRTQGRYDELGEFTDETRPSKAQVEKLIDDAVNDVSDAVGDLGQDEVAFPCVERMRERAKSAAVIYTAMLIELGYFPEQTSGAFSPYDRLEKLYDKKMKVLKEAVAECIGGGGGESVGGEGGSGGGNFPSGDFGDLKPIGETNW